MELFKVFTEVLGTTGVKISLLAGFYLIFIGIVTPVFSKLFKKELRNWFRTSLSSILGGSAFLLIAALFCIFFNEGLSAISVFAVEILPLLKYSIGGVATICLLCFIYINIMRSNTGVQDK